MIIERLATHALAATSPSQHPHLNGWPEPSMPGVASSPLTPPCWRNLFHNALAITAGASWPLSRKDFLARSPRIHLSCPQLRVPQSSHRIWPAVPEVPTQERARSRLQNILKASSRSPAPTTAFQLPGTKRDTLLQHRQRAGEQLASWSMRSRGEPSLMVSGNIKSLLALSNGATGCCCIAFAARHRLRALHQAFLCRPATKLRPPCAVFLSIFQTVKLTA